MLAEQQRAEFCDLAKEISKTRYLTNRNVLNLDLREKTDAFGWQMAGHIAYQIINRLKRNITP